LGEKVAACVVVGHTSLFYLPYIIPKEIDLLAVTACGQIGRLKPLTMR